MARGDIVSDVQSISSGANLDFQPSAGVEVLVTHMINQGAASLQLYDGSNANGFLVVMSAQPNSTQFAGPLKMLINNTNYLRISEASTSTNVLGYTGVQTK